MQRVRSDEKVSQSEFSNVSKKLRVSAGIDENFRALLCVGVYGDITIPYNRFALYDPSHLLYHTLCTNSPDRSYSIAAHPGE